MDSFKIRDKKADKANATLKHRRIQEITTVFRFLELFIFFIILSRFSTQLSFSFNLPGEYFRGLSATFISPRFVFLVGNAIIIVLFFISGQFSSGEGEKGMDFYDEYMESCRNNRYDFREEDRLALVYNEPKKMSRCRSEKLERAARGKDLRRSVSEKCQKSGQKATDDEMSSEEFRRTVEAFIARQQRILKEEEEEE